MNNNKHNFRPYDPDQMMLMPPSLHDWLPDDHLAHFVRETIEELNLAAILDTYDGSKGGCPAYNAVMMTQLLTYGYCVGVRSSRKIERATTESVPFRVLAANQHPDHDTIAAFRRRHAEALAGLFKQILELCRERGMVKLGHVVIDGTKVRANASKHKAMSYGRMKKKDVDLKELAKQILADAERIDAEEEALYGKGKRGDELPEEFRNAKTRRSKIREGIKALEERTKAEADKKRAEIEEKEKQREEEGDDKPRGGRKAKKPSNTPEDKMQYNFTDPESRIMKMGSTGSFEQCYNAQVAVDVDSQVIVAADVTQQPNDKQQLKPMVEQVKKNTESKPKTVSADTGYYSDANAEAMRCEAIDAHIATKRDKHGERVAAPRGRIRKSATTKDRMQRKLRTKKGRATYAKRKSSVEPVIGQIKEVQRFRQFLRRGLDAAKQEWTFGCAIHNLLKLFRNVRAAAAR
jgi:transposase